MQTEDMIPRLAVYVQLNDDMINSNHPSHIAESVHVNSLGPPLTYGTFCSNTIMPVVKIIKSLRPWDCISRICYTICRLSAALGHKTQGTLLRKNSYTVCTDGQKFLTTRPKSTLVVNYMLCANGRSLTLIDNATVCGDTAIISRWSEAIHLYVHQNHIIFIFSLTLNNMLSKYFFTTINKMNSNLYQRKYIPWQDSHLINK